MFRYNEVETCNLEGEKLPIEYLTKILNDTAEYYSATHAAIEYCKTGFANEHGEEFAPQIVYYKYEEESDYRYERRIERERKSTLYSLKGKAIIDTVLHTLCFVDSYDLVHNTVTLAYGVYGLPHTTGIDEFCKRCRYTDHSEIKL